MRRSLLKNARDRHPDVPPGFDPQNKKQFYAMLDKVSPSVGPGDKPFGITFAAPGECGMETVWASNKTEARKTFFLQHPRLKPEHLITLQFERHIKPPRPRVSAVNTMKSKPTHFQLNPQFRHEIILSALGHFTDDWISKESRRLHKNGVPQTQAIKQCLGTGGAARKQWSWHNHKLGLEVKLEDEQTTIIPWSDMVPYIWPPKPVVRKPIRGKVKTEAWSAL